MRYLKLVLIALLLTGCVRTSSVQTFHVPTPSPTTPGDSTHAVKSQAGETPTPSQKSSGEAGTTLRAASQTPAAAGTLSSETHQTLLDFPMVAGNSWVYRYEAYSGQEKAVWKVADTIVQDENQSPYYGARVQREATLLEGSPTKDFIDPPQSSSFWYVANDASLFRSDDPIQWDQVTSSWLEIRFPLPGDACWYPDGSQRAQSPTPGLPGCRSASGPAAVDVPAGHFTNCYQVTTLYNSGNTTFTFCRGVGIVEGNYHHAGTEYGYHFTLTAYLLQ